MRCVFGFAVSLCLVSGAWAAEPVAPRVGPVSVGMSVEAAQVALPSAAWANVVSPHTGKIIGTKADAAWTLDEQPYQIGLQSWRYGAAALTLRSQTQAGSVRTCRARVLALAAYFEEFFGELRPADASITFKTRKAGRNAQVGEAEAERDNDLYSDFSVYSWFFAQAPSGPYPFGITAAAQFVQEKGSCAIAADVTVPATNRPDFEVLDTKMVRPAHQPPPEILSASLEGLDLPKGGKTIQLNCEVVRASGAPRDCFEGARGSTPTPEGRAATVRAYYIVFDPKQLDPDNDVPLRVTLAIKLSPAERRAQVKLGAPKNPPPPLPMQVPSPPSRTPSSLKVVWTKVPTANELSARYPAVALRDGIKGSIVASCTVRADLSLSCQALASDPPGVFEAAGQSVFELYRVAPVLKDGTLAVGTTLKQRVLFRIEE